MKVLGGLIAALALALAGCGSTCSDGDVEHEVNGVIVSARYVPCDRRCAKEIPRTECGCSRQCP
jgi:hypothetical protein